MKQVYYRIAHLLIGLITKTFGNIHSPWTRKNILFNDIVNIKKVLQKGDIILTRTNGEFTTLMIPGFWKHVAIYIGNDQIIDATGAGVRLRWLPDLAMHTDNISIYRVKNYTPIVGTQIVEYSRLQIGKQYDFEMDINEVNTFYCSELAYCAINSAIPNYLDLRETLGIPTLTPEDISLAIKKFDKIYEKLS